MHKTKSNVGSFTIKVDLAKAYDNISWSFINNVLSEVGVPVILKDLIMLDVTFVKIRVLWKGDICELYHHYLLILLRIVVFRVGLILGSSPSRVCIVFFSHDIDIAPNYHWDSIWKL